MIRPDPASDDSADPASAETLLAACADGDREAFRMLYRRFSPAAYGLSLRVLHDEQLAQDALQEAFAQVWVQAGRFDPAMGSGRAWILRVAHRRAVDRVRREEADRRRGLTWGWASWSPITTRSPRSSSCAPTTAECAQRSAL